MRTVISIVAGKSSTATSGSRNSKYFPTIDAGTLLLPINRHSSNNVKMMKIETSETKPTTKLVVSVPKRLVSSKLGKPERPAPTVCSVVLTVEVSGVAIFGFTDFLANVIFGRRWKTNSVKLNKSITAVAIHSPMIAGTVLFRAIDSPSSDIR